MTNKRMLVNQYMPANHPGFLGAGHVARALMQGDFADTDPFILLMDDMLDKKDDHPAGGPHPHAGFETVTLLIEGELGSESHTMKAGDLEIMTAGSGVIHTETIEKKTKLRILQLWLTLPKKDRWAAPRVQNIPDAHVHKTEQDGFNIKLYSGSLAGISSPVKNHTPVIIADIRAASDAETEFHIPATYSTFLYVLEGTVLVGGNRKPLGADEVGWLNRPDKKGESELLLSTAGTAARFVLYSGEPQGVPVVSHGPFIGDTTEDIDRLYRAFRSGKMKHISTVAETQKFNW